MYPSLSKPPSKSLTRRRTSLVAGLTGLILCAAPLAPSWASTEAEKRDVICNTHCDARDPQHALDDRVAVDATVHSRVIKLHFSDRDGMGWASIDNGSPGDEVWLDRSFDAGESTSDSRLGVTTTPSGSRGWRTQMYNVDDPANSRVGSLRACGKAGDRGEIACTPWTPGQPGPHGRSEAAADGLMAMYNTDTGLFDTNGWWTSANALTAVIDNIEVTGSNRHEHAISRTYETNLDSHDGDFTNEYLDDTGWWGLAWIAAYDHTGDTRYLDTARADAAHMADYWTNKCGGGVQWNVDVPYKNAITNELYLHLNAALHNRIPGDTHYLAEAQKEWDWFRNSGMINSSGLVNDGLTDDTCANNGQPTWTYNQGVLLGGLTELHRATGDGDLLRTARRLADASTGADGLHSDGVLHEPNESDQCDNDGSSFKGAYVRGLGALNAQLDDHPYSGYLDRQADAAYRNDRNAQGLYGPHWAGPWTDSGHGCQHSALDLFNAAEVN
ncbi:glycoside hydrolase family 76 protein [Streptomyces sp. N2-109]|uniref:Glycoside hydrolase family 76 protein n=1 Tax=Streptomyces gossypii TaxID=2883101 RepID=A0ABT2JWA1_9ACTN|nr:glycoside hydrolase family 76 protein [Streptomyces gossypii]MCT2591724.1 glycoside hydrolase family 76 protein [Streptomyces gossypii]